MITLDIRGETRDFSEPEIMKSIENLLFQIDNVHLGKQIYRLLPLLENKIITSDIYTFEQFTHMFPDDAPDTVKSDMRLQSILTLIVGTSLLAKLLEQEKFSFSQLTSTNLLCAHKSCFFTLSERPHSHTFFAVQHCEDVEDEDIQKYTQKTSRTDRDYAEAGKKAKQNFLTAGKDYASFCNIPERIFPHIPIETEVLSRYIVAISTLILGLEGNKNAGTEFAKDIYGKWVYIDENGHPFQGLFRQYVLST